MSIIVLTDRGGPSNCSMMDKDPRQNPKAPPFSFPPNLCYCESSKDSRLLVWPEAPSLPLCMIYCFGEMLSLSFLAWPQTVDPLQHLLPGTGCVISHPVLGSSLILAFPFPHPCQLFPWSEREQSCGALAISALGVLIPVFLRSRASLFSTNLPDSRVEGSQDRESDRWQPLFQGLLVQERCGPVTDRAPSI